MASKVIYSVVAVVGLALASGAAWWVQHKPQAQVAPEGVATSPREGRAPAGGPGRPPVVEAAAVQLVPLSDDTQAVGNLRSRQSVMLRPEVAGRVTRLNFRDGEPVRKGQWLVQLDDQLPQAQLAQSRAELSIARANHQRNQELVAQNFISQRSLDESSAALQVAQAKVALAEATTARLKIVAPFDGVAGIRSVNVGDYLKDGADIVNIEDMAALYVDFRLPERFQAKLRRGQPAEVSVDALPGRTFSALVQAIDPLVDANGRSVGVRACIDNRALQLRPGMFARVSTVFGVREQARVIPEEAIVPQGGKQYVVKLLDGPDAQSRTTRRVEVRVGLRQPGRVEILDGLAPGDRVVTAGHQRLQRDGTVVRLVESGRGGAEAAAGATARPAPAVAPADGPTVAPAPASPTPASARPTPMAEGSTGANPCRLDARAS